MAEIELSEIYVDEGMPTSELDDRLSMMKFTAEALRYIVSKNQGKRERMGRWHQLEIVENGTFRIVDPISGKMVHSSDSYIMNDKTTFFRFHGSPDVVAASSNLGDGYPIGALIFLSLKLAMRFGKRDWEVSSAHIASILEILKLPQWINIPNYPCEIRLVVGDANFAHYSWNNLSLIESVLERGLQNRNISLIYTHEPLGSVVELFDCSEKFSSRYCPDSYLERENEPGILHVASGGFYINERLCKRIVAKSANYLSAEAKKVAERLRKHGDTGPIFWISIRTVNRTPVNQTAFIVELVSRCLDYDHKSLIVFDGHSYPVDFETNNSYDRAKAHKNVENDRRAVDDILSSFLEGGEIKVLGSLVSIVGLNAMESIHIAQFANFYCCHHGTVQHKIGWFNPVPGVIHSNREVLAWQPAAWVADQSALARTPSYLPEKYIVDLDIEPPYRGDGTDGLAHGSYHIADVDGAAGYVIKEFQRLTNSIDDHAGIYYTTFLYSIHQRMRPRTYLEIGVELGRTLSLATCKSIAIDPEFRLENGGGVINKDVAMFFQITSDDFFAKYSVERLLGSPLDFAFLDGMHHFEFLMRDFINVERECHGGSIIAIHDCLPTETPMADRNPGSEPIRKGREGAWTGDVWKFGLILKTYRPDLRVRAYDAQPTGLLVVDHVDPQSKALQNQYNSIVEEMSALELSRFGIKRFFDIMEVVSCVNIDADWPFEYAFTNI